jgi:hypothetical protein
MKGEIVIYQIEENNDFQLEVQVENETVWLSQNQMVDLFDSTKQNISLHINNVFKEGELLPEATVKEHLTVQKEGKRSVKRKITVYNLDVIISVGYRVKSKRGTHFRIWANKIIKDYLLKGYAVHHRIEKIEKQLVEHEQKFEFLINTNLPLNEGIFFDGQIYDAWQFVSDLIRNAKSSVILIDNYIDETVLTLLSKRNQNTEAVVYTSAISTQLKTDIKKFNSQYTAIEFKIFKKSHDRFLIIDRQTIYHIGASIKDLGKKWFAFSKINLDINELLDKLN